MPDVERKRKIIIDVLYLALIVVIGLFVVRYALGVCFPFVFAFLIAVILQKPKNFLVKKTFLKNGAASTLCVFLLLFIVLALVSLIGVRVFNEVKGFISYLVSQFSDINKIVDNVEAWLVNLINSLPEFIRKTLSESVSDLFTKLREYTQGQSAGIGQQITGGLGDKFQMSWITGPLSGVISTAKQIPSIVIAIVITLVACCFMTTEYDVIIHFIKCQFPENRRKDLSRAKTLLKDSLGKMGRAYLLIMLVTFIEMSVGLTVMKLIGIFDSSYIMVIAAATAIVDIVPVLGTGTVVIPWAVYSFITGDVALGIGLLIIYAAITVIRQVIEPKLVAGQLGLSPIITIAALYFGLKVFGVLGMFITPIIVIMLKLLNDEGIINLWRSPVRIAKQAAEAAQEEAATTVTSEEIITQEKSEESSEE